MSVVTAAVSYTHLDVYKRQTETKEDIKKDNVDLFKTIMTAYGWEFYQEMYLSLIHI